MSRTALAPNHAREYETVYILRPNLEKDAANDVATRVADAIKGGEGVLTKAELWGQRRLAYPIKKHHRGTYVYIKYLAGGDVVTEIERQLRLVDSVIRYQTIVLQDNVPTGAPVDVSDDDIDLDFDLPFEADEPEVPRERELGLDAPPPERRRRDRDRDRDPKPQEEAAPAPEAKEEPKEAKEEPAAEKKSEASEGEGS
ncbi:MAG: 30S ribosomal protein S6 [Myxococcota bacterium]